MRRENLGNEAVESCVTAAYHTAEDGRDDKVLILVGNEGQAD